MSKQFDNVKHPKIVYIVEEHAFIQAKLGVAIGFDILYLINGSGAHA